MTKFSIVIPVYNMEGSIEKTVKQLLKQTYDQYEIILVDDGSKDNSGKLCDKLSTLDRRISVIHTINQGSGPARNEGIKAAKGDYIYFPDADDYVSEKALEILDKKLEEKPRDLIVFGYKNLRLNGKELGTKTYKEVAFPGEKIRKNYSRFFAMDAEFGIQGAPWNKLFSLQIIRENNLQFPPLRRHQDDAFIGEYMNYAGDVLFIGDVLYSYFNNNLSREWDRYPLDYFDCVKGLYECRKQNILAWNKEDKKTHNLVELNYITSTIKSMELFFSPKYRFSSKKERLRAIKELIEKSEIAKKEIAPEFDMKYQRNVLKLIKEENYKKLYNLLHVKIITESKFGSIFEIIKKQFR